MTKFIQIFGSFKSLFCRTLILAAAVLVGQNAWAVDETIFSITDITGPTNSLASKAGADLEATIVGGSAYLYNSKNASVAMVVSGKVYLIDNKSYCKITLTKALAEGDAITCDANDALCFTESDTRATDHQTDNNNKYDVTSDLSGKNVIYIWKTGSGSTTFGSLTITRTSAETKTATTTTFPESSYEFAIGGSFTSPTATVEAGGTALDNPSVTYSSSDTDVATVEASTGVLTLVAAGSTTITATYAGDDAYSGSNSSYTLTVTTASTDLYICGISSWSPEDTYKMTETKAGSEWTYDFGATEMVGKVFKIHDDMSLWLGSNEGLKEGTISLSASGYDISVGSQYSSATNVKITLKKTSQDGWTLEAVGTFVEGEPTIPDLYLRGINNKWDATEDNKLIRNGENYEWTRTIGVTNSDMFKVADANYGSYNFGAGTNPTVCLDQDYTLVNGSNTNLSLDGTPTGDYTFTVRKDNDTWILKVTAPSAPLDPESGCGTGSGSSYDIRTGASVTFDESAGSDEIIRRCKDSTVNVMVKRTFYRDGNSNTICLPFSLTSGQIAAGPLKGCSLKKVIAADVVDAGTDGESLSLRTEDVDAIEAGIPYIISWEDGDDIVNPVFEGVTVTAVEPESVELGNNVTFTGTFIRSEQSGGRNKMFLGARGELYWPEKDGSLKGFRCWFSIDK